MFKVKKVTQDGQCRAMRCKSASHQATAWLCHKHHAEWTNAGQPDLDAIDPGTGTDLTLAVPGTLKTQLDTERLEAQEVLALVQSLPTDTEEQRTYIGALHNQAAQKIADLEAQRTSVTGPMHQIKKTIDGWFSPTVQYYTQIKKALADKLLTHQRLAEQAQVKALQTVQDGVGLATAEVFEVAHNTPAPPANVGVRRRIMYTVEDFDALPAEYKITLPDHAKLRGMVDAQGLDMKVPGVRVYEELAISKGRVG